MDYGPRTMVQGGPREALMLLREAPIPSLLAPREKGRRRAIRGKPRRFRRFSRRGASPSGERPPLSPWRFSEPEARLSRIAAKTDASPGEKRLVLRAFRGASPWQRQYPAGRRAREGEAAIEGWPRRYAVASRPSTTLQRLAERSRGIPSDAGWAGPSAAAVAMQRLLSQSPQKGRRRTQELVKSSL
jgi:hypothetical protein